MDGWMGKKVGSMGSINESMDMINASMTDAKVHES
jgi:hypothetical protein